VSISAQARLAWYAEHQSDGQWLPVAAHIIARDANAEIGRGYWRHVIHFEMVLWFSREHVFVAYGIEKNPALGHG
jgi:hypothetical protein